MSTPGAGPTTISGRASGAGLTVMSGAAEPTDVADGETVPVSVPLPLTLPDVSASDSTMSRHRGIFSGGGRGSSVDRSFDSRRLCDDVGEPTGSDGERLGGGGGCRGSDASDERGRLGGEVGLGCA